MPSQHTMLPRKVDLSERGFTWRSPNEPWGYRIFGGYRYPKNHSSISWLGATVYLESDVEDFRFGEIGVRTLHHLERRLLEAHNLFDEGGQQSVNWGFTVWIKSRIQTLYRQFEKISGAKIPHECKKWRKGGANLTLNNTRVTCIVLGWYYQH